MTEIKTMKICKKVVPLIAEYNKILNKRAQFEKQKKLAPKIKILLCKLKETIDGDLYKLEDNERIRLKNE